MNHWCSCSSISSHGSRVPKDLLVTSLVIIIIIPRAKHEELWPKRRPTSLLPPMINMGHWLALGHHQEEGEGPRFPAAVHRRGSAGRVVRRRCGRRIRRRWWRRRRVRSSGDAVPRQSLGRGRELRELRELLPEAKGANAGWLAVFRVLLAFYQCCCCCCYRFFSLGWSSPSALHFNCCYRTCSGSAYIVYIGMDRQKIFSFGKEEEEERRGREILVWCFGESSRGLRCIFLFWKGKKWRERERESVCSKQGFFDGCEFWKSRRMDQVETPYEPRLMSPRYI